MKKYTLEFKLGAGDYERALNEFARKHKKLIESLKKKAMEQVNKSHGKNSSLDIYAIGLAYERALNQLLTEAFDELTILGFSKKDVE